MMIWWRYFTLIYRCRVMNEEWGCSWNKCPPPGGEVELRALISGTPCSEGFTPCKEVVWQIFFSFFFVIVGEYLGILCFLWYLVHITSRGGKGKMTSSGFPKCPVNFCTLHWDLQIH
jgi:hypothetical protein